MDWNIIFNGVLAFVAVVGFIISLYFSRQTLKQAKALNDKAVNAQLFEKRYEVIAFFEKFIDITISPRFDDLDLLPKYLTMMDILFKNTLNFRFVLVDLTHYCAISDTKVLKERMGLSNVPMSDSEALSRFYSCYKIYLQDLKNELGIIELEKTKDVF